MTLVITEDIKSVTELKRKTNAIIEQLHKTKRPVVLTVNGKAQAVLLDAKEYEKIIGAFELAKSILSKDEDNREKKNTEFKRLLDAFSRNNSI